VLSAHERGGVKRNGSLDRPGMTLTASDREDLLAYLIAEAWKAGQRFRPGDDGRRPGNRLAGYVVKTLHFRLVDWIRLTKGSTRYPTSRVTTLVPLTPAIEERMAPFRDPEYDDGSVLDHDEMSAETLEALELVRPLVDEPRLTHGDLAARGGVSSGRIGKAMRLVREEAIRQGLAPTNAAEVATRAVKRSPTDTAPPVALH
jgi:DNA-directed RNA polymerase specialized sigma24 family protein